MISPAAARFASRVDGRFVQGHIEIARMHPDQLFAAVAEAVAGLAVDVDHGELLVQQKKGVCRAVDKRAEARLARAQLLLGDFTLRNVYRSAHQLHDISGAIQDGAPDRANMPDPTVGQHDPVLV